MITLEDLAVLRREGDGGGIGLAWEGFKADPRVRSLQWPEPVVRQFLFDHGRKADFIEQYGHLDLNKLSWRLERRTSEDIAAASTFRDFDWAETVEQHFEHFLKLRAPAERLSWAERGTWLEAPVAIEAAALRTPGKTDLHLVEGHTRLGMLRAHVRRGLVDGDLHHEIWVGHHPA